MQCARGKAAWTATTTIRDAHCFCMQNNSNNKNNKEELNTHNLQQQQQQQRARHLRRWDASSAADAQIGQAAKTSEWLCCRRRCRRRRRCQPLINQVIWKNGALQFARCCCCSFFVLFKWRARLPACVCVCELSGRVCGVCECKRVCSEWERAESEVRARGKSKVWSVSEWGAHVCARSKN